MSQQLEEQILKQNVLEEHRQVHELQVRIKELRADVERYVAINAQLLEDLEKAKTQLAKLRGQEPVFYYTPQAYCMNTAVVSRTPWESGMENIPLYAAPVAAAPRKYHEFASVMLDAQHRKAAREYRNLIKAIKEQDPHG